MSLDRFQQLLKQTMGLDAASIGVSAIQRAVQARMRAGDLGDVQSYWARLNASQGELQALIEEVVVPETWFFRDSQAFAAMARIAMDEWLPKAGDRPLRLLSLPCSTGEEPYTMAMALLDAGFPADRIQIDAIDISSQSLAYARAGSYGQNSFRGADLAFRDRYFTASGKRHILSDPVKALVRFGQGNLFDPTFGSGTQPYDFVFCRNLLIYFDAADQGRAIGVLRRMLAAQGLLFIGHSEASLALEHGFVSARIPLAFAFRKASAVAPAKPQPKPAPVKAKTAPPPLPSRPRAFPQIVKTVPMLGLGEARRLADQGRLTEAARICEDHLCRTEPSAEALHLLGVISDAAGDRAQAAHYYRKALYLEPNHRETLTHLSLLLEGQGDHSAATLLKNRIRRLDMREGV